MSIEQIRENDAESRRKVWQKVFDVISSHSYTGTRELIKKLEQARDIDGMPANFSIPSKPQVLGGRRKGDTAR